MRAFAFELLPVGADTDVFSSAELEASLDQIDS
jgi:hypothetical protein